MTTKKSIRWPWSVLALMALLALLALAGMACGAGAAPDTPPPSRASEERPGVNATDVEAAAVADLAAHLRVPRDAIEVVRTETLTWPDGALGCPEASPAARSGAVPGHRVLLTHGGRLYRYHAAVDDAPFLCPSGERDGGHEFVPPPGIDD